MANKVNVDRLAKVLSDILSDKYGCKVTIEFIPKESAMNKEKEEYKCLRFDFRA